MTHMPVCCTMVSVVVVRSGRDGDQVLLLRRRGDSLAGVWSYVAGHLQVGESGWQCALRELAEETALVPAALYSADWCESYYDARAECVQTVPAFVAFVADGAVVRCNHEHDASVWLAFDEALPRLPFGSQRQLFEHVRREFVERAPPDVLRMPPR